MSIETEIIIAVAMALLSLLALLVLVCILIARTIRGGLRGAWYLVAQILRLSGWAAFGLIVLGAASLVAGRGVNLLLAGATLVVLAMVLDRREQVRRDALVELLAVGSERNMSLEPLLTAFGSEWRGPYAWRIERLVRELQAGVPLADALGRVRGLARRQSICAARIGAQTGQLGAALRDVVDLRIARGPLWNQLIGRGWLLLWPVFGVLILTLLWSLFLYPRLEQVWDDFGFEGPLVTQLLGRGAQLAEVRLAVASLLALAICLAGWLTLAYIGWLPFGLPLVGRTWTQIEATPVLRQLALVCESGRSLGDGLRLIADDYPAASVRRRLSRAVAAIESGQDWSAALVATKLISPADAGVLTAAARSGHASWALRVTAETNERRFTHRLLAALQLVFPAAILVIGLLVLIMLLGVFDPLVRLTIRLSQ